MKYYLKANHSDSDYLHIRQNHFHSLVKFLLSFKLSHFIIPSHRSNKIRLLVKTSTHWERFNLKLEFMIKVEVTLFKITSAKLCAFSLFRLYPHLIRFNVIGWISSEFTRNSLLPNGEYFRTELNSDEVSLLRTMWMNPCCRRKMGIYLIDFCSKRQCWFDYTFISYHS